jgi:uncharacterized protein YndB with AHSA1/START domain
MATNETYVKASPEAVFGVLADARSYGHWVVGSSRTERVEGEWPEQGSFFQHVQGAFGIGLRDTTSVISVDPPREIVLEARIRPFAVNRVELRLRPHASGTRITIVEYATGGIAGLLYNPLLDRLTWLRNGEALRRLRKMAEEGRTA